MAGLAWRRLATRPVPLQAKLTVNAPGDSYEREADRVADQVLRVSELGAGGGAHGPPAEGLPPTIQRMCPECEEEQLQRQLPEDEEEESLQAKRDAAGAPPAVSRRTEGRIAALRGGGSPLPGPVRGYFEPRFGRSFHGVRVHTGGEAAAAARDVRARAFTFSSDIAFAPGEYRPDTAGGRRLLAHELVHTVQQRAGAPGTIRRYRDLSTVNFGDCDDAPAWVEKEFADKNKDPWIEKITVHFDGTATDVDGDVVPTGKLSATYFANSAKLPDLAGISIVGGKASQGLSDRGNHSVKRIEGCGYHDTSVPKGDRVTGHKRGFKYFQPSKVSQATMSFAVFFVQGKSSGNQAVHEGSLSSGSLACVHVGSSSTIRQINYHSRVGQTKVDVTYDAATLKTVCCERHKAKGYMVSNPCKGQDASACP